jgi:hypothetical protein
MRNGSAEGKTKAVGALRTLALNATNKSIIASEGGIPPLIALMRDGTAEEKTLAADALENLAICLESVSEDGSGDSDADSGGGDDDYDNGGGGDDYDSGGSDDDD